MPSGILHCVIYLTVMSAFAGYGGRMPSFSALREPIVLLVDDHEDSAAMYAIGLLAMGFQPVACGTATGAFARACQIRPDVVVADLSSMDGSEIDLTRRLRSDPRTDQVGIIVLTGQMVGSTKEAAIEAGCDRFLVKPCLPDVLALEIRDVLNRRQSLR
jgi:two-component system, cell cycle response regulator DivK